MLQTFKNGQNSVILRVKLLDSSKTDGSGLTGLTSASTGLIISTIADNEATATAYTVAGSTIESITTLGTYSAPTATKCRFKEVDSTNHKGVYEIQIADARFAVANAKSLLVSIAGATNLAQADFVVQLQADDPQVAKPTNFASLSVDGSGRVDVAKIAGTSQTARDIGASVLLSAGTGTGQLDFSSGVVKGNVTQFGGAAGTFSSGIPAVNATQFAGTAYATALIAEIAALLDTARSGHTTSGTVGEAIDGAFNYGDRVVCRGTVSGSPSPSTTGFTTSALSPAGAAADQFKGRIIVFDKATATAALRGQATDITANTSATNPALTFTALTTAPSSGDTFSIV